MTALRVSRSLPFVVVAVLIASVLVGLSARRAVVQGRRPIDQARDLSERGHYEEAERIFLDVARSRPFSLPAVIELLDNHQRFALALSAVGHPTTPAGSTEAIEADERAIAALLVAPDLPSDVARLARWWSQVTRGEETDDDRSRIVAVAAGHPPVAWANHLLGRLAHDSGDDIAAAEFFASEAIAFDARGDDADSACLQWLEDKNGTRAAAALASPRFARQVSPSIRLQLALESRDWLGIVRWFFPAQYDGVTTGIAALAFVSAFIWFGLCAQIGRLAEKPRRRWGLYLTAFALGVGSAYLALALALAEHLAGFVEKGQLWADAIFFVVGVGLREELSKALLLLPLALLLRRSGERREVFACGALVGLGFAAEENIGYLHAGLSTALSRFLTANFLHMSTTGLVAAAMDDAFRDGGARPSSRLSTTLMVVVAAHGLYDFSLSATSDLEGIPFIALIVFAWLARRFVAVLRGLRGREGPLLRMFCVGLASVAGATFVYACTLVGPRGAALALFDGALGLAVVTYMFVQEFRAV